jgi:regulator of protease activity HflC (stomatin/prohibitin superfamily)
VIVTIIFIALAVLALVAVLFVLPDSVDRLSPGRMLAAGGLIVAALGLIIGGLGFVEVPAGHVGVQTTFGRIHEQTLPPGLHWRMPFVDHVSAMDTRVQVYSFENVEGASSDLQPVNLTGIVNFHLDPAQAANIFQRVGVDYKDKVFTRPAETILKSVTPAFRASDIVARRNEIGDLTQEALQAEVGHYGLIVDGVSVANIGLSAEFLRAIDEKVRAEQEALKERTLVEVSRQRAQQAIELAHGDAEAAIERARGQAEANRLVAESLSDGVLQWQYIQKIADKVSVIYLPANQQFLLPLPTTP